MKKIISYLIIIILLISCKKEFKMPLKPYIITYKEYKNYYNSNNIWFYKAVSKDMVIMEFEDNISYKIGDTIK